MRNEQLLAAIKNQGDELVKKAEWYQKMLDQQNRTVQTMEDTIANTLVEMAALNRSISALREEYKRELGKEGPE